MMWQKKTGGPAEAHRFYSGLLELENTQCLEDVLLEDRLG